MLSKNLLDEIGLKKFLDDSINEAVESSEVYTLADKYGKWVEYESLKHLVACRVLQNIPSIITPGVYYEMESDLEKVDTSRCSQSMKICKKILKELPHNLISIVKLQAEIEYGDVFLNPRSIYRYLKKYSDIKLKPEDIKIDRDTEKIQLRFG